MMTRKMVLGMMVLRKKWVEYAGGPGAGGRGKRQKGLTDDDEEDGGHGKIHGQVAGGAREVECAEAVHAARALLQHLRWGRGTRHCQQQATAHHLWEEEGHQRM